MKLSEDGPSKYLSAATLVALLFCSIAASAEDVKSSDMVPAEDSLTGMSFMLLQIQADVQGSLNDLDQDVANASFDLSATGLEGTNARLVLSRLLETNSNLAEAVTFGKDGKIIVAECRGCEGGESQTHEEEEEARLLEGYRVASEGVTYLETS